MIPTPGRIVEYTLSEQDVEQINRRRRHAAEHMREHQEAQLGVVVHVGNRVEVGDVFPMVIVRCWGSTEESSVNGQVLLDGSDTFWTTSVSQGDGPRHWRPFARIEG